MTAARGESGSGTAFRSWLRGGMGALLTAAVLLGAGGARAQGRGEPVDAALRAKIVDQLSTALKEHYVFPEVAKKMEASLRQKLKAGAYDKISNSDEFTDVLTRDMREVSKDKHLGVAYVPPQARDMFAEAKPNPAQREKFRREVAADNYGFEKVERLSGNVGYLDLRGFVDASIAGETAIAAMGFLSNSDALIIDLRRNGGGSPSMIQLITSYFFDEPTHLNDFFIRKGNVTQQFWTSANVAGKRMSDVPVYVLTSARTFSAAEEFTYDLKNLKRATIVGETTGGGAHPVDAHYLAEVHLVAHIPFGRAVNPITNTNWEGTGVAPDIQVPADKALEVAHLEALKKLQAKATDAEQKQRFAWALQKVEALATPVTVTPELLKSFTGTYGMKTISYENGSLYYQRQQNGPKLRAIPMSADTLMIDGMDWVRLRLEKDASGKVTGLTGMFGDGRTDTTPRT